MIAAAEMSRRTHDVQVQVGHAVGGLHRLARSHKMNAQEVSAKQRRNGSQLYGPNQLRCR